MGVVQGLSLPFRGFSRSGSTISAGMLAGTTREHAETFSFALAVVLTPAVVGYEVMRLVKATHEAAANWHGPEFTGNARAKFSGDGSGVCGRPYRTQVAVELARIREVVSLRNLLSCGIRSGFLSSCSGL